MAKTCEVGEMVSHNMFDFPHVEPCGRPKVADWHFGDGGSLATCSKHDREVRGDLTVDGALMEGVERRPSDTEGA